VPRHDSLPAPVGPACQLARFCFGFRRTFRGSVEVGTNAVTGSFTRTFGTAVFLALLALLFGSSCDTFGLPAYRPPEEIQSTAGEGKADILDINPKFGRIGEETTINIRGINTTFTDSTTVSFPDEPEIEVLDLNVLDVMEMDVLISIGVRAVPGEHALEVTTDADGTLSYREGFVVVE